MREHRFRRKLAGPRLLRAFAAAYPKAFFVEIGANDGEQHDHLRRLIRESDWHGIMVEPVPFVFGRLERNYGSLGRVALENVAIADRDGELPFFHLEEAEPAERSGLPPWYDAVGSFSRAVVAGHGAEIPDIEQRIVETRVPCLTFDSLCRKHGDPRVDLLLIDVEGYDAELLGTINLDRHHPRLLVYEHYHLDADERRACATRIEGSGYETLAEGFDTFCLDTGTDDELTMLWGRLEPAILELSVHDPRAAHGG